MPLDSARIHEVPDDPLAALFAERHGCTLNALCRKTNASAPAP